MCTPSGCAGNPRARDGSDDGLHHADDPLAAVRVERALGRQ
jgi:hypothetical protein